MSKSWLHDAFFEEAKKEEPVEVITPKPQLVPTAGVYPPDIAVASIQASSQSSPVDDNQMYDKLKQNTGIELLPSLQKIFALAKPLETVLPDPVVRLKAAFAQATAAQGLALADVTKDISQLDSLLNEQKRKFDFTVQRETTAIADSEKQAADLETQLHNLRQTISDRKSKLDRGSISFGAAFNRRQSEVNQLKSQLANL